MNRAASKFLDEERALEPLCSWGFGEETVRSLDKFQFLQRNPSQGTKESGSVR